MGITYTVYRYDMPIMAGFKSKKSARIWLSKHAQPFATYFIEMELSITKMTPVYVEEDTVDIGGEG